jgi:hypothetical protein
MRSAALAAIPIKDRRPIYEWARDHYKFTPPLVRTDPLNIQECRHFQAPFDSWDNDAKREISIRAGVRSGKTMFAEVCVGHRIKNYPCEIMWVTGKAPLADQEWNTRMERMFLASPQIAELLPEPTQQGSRRNKATGLVELKNGSNLFVHGNALLNLQQKGICCAVHDECWNWETGRLGESYGRVGDYLKMGISKILNISQGGEDESDWDRVYNQGSCSEWEVQCLGCGGYFPPAWSHNRTDGQLAGMRWAEHKDEHGFWIIQKVLESVHYECPLCGHIHTDTPRTKQEWNRTGRYVATNVNARPEKDSYHWPGTIDWPWVELVDKFLQAVNARKQGNLTPLIEFFQKYMAENKSEMSILESVVSFSREVYDLRTKWSDELARFFTVDVQETVYWATVRQWSKDGRSRRLWFGRLTSYADIEQKREEYGVKPVLTALDSGHKAKGDTGVYAACVRYGWFALKGDPEKTFHHTEGTARVEHSYSEQSWGDPEIGHGPMCGKKAPLVRFSSDIMADRLDGLIATGMWIEPPETRSDIDELYKHQMAGEWKKQFRDPATNRIHFRRVVSKKYGNHAYDCGKMQVCLATLAGILPDKST